MRHNTNSRTVIQIKKVYNTCVTVCVVTHTHTHTWRSHGRISLAGQILWAGKAEKGEVASPLMTTYRENSKTERLSLGFLKAEQNA